ncbi:aminotransferase class I/II-fold pyridoxal phosphate-dependent enzyme [Rhodospirillaceae bacterium KN72]|uniref:Aminotransferase n=1 Tax=Pacificispira spongiicola TaxID=2729598 RepID=A0A7Y0HEA2_9PROT|nr:aminotransferase class I/II-fold pyridoxal phosphate-dependent enzyme [Pacificispira spongiicola]NMM44646.1 aminotransferase class I/II-fold pyridoxal phosphate-dependent enzyme [Pacificispira spongiicola]
MALKVGRRGAIPAFLVMEVMRAAALREREGKAVYHLEVGQPGTSAPRGVIEAAHKALDGDRIGYTVALGIPELRAAIATDYADRYGIKVPEDRIVVTTGSSGGFILSFLAAFDPGDRVALAAPGYPCYRHILSALGIDPVMLPAQAEDRFQPTPALLEKAMEDGPIDGLIVASPSNPAGTMLGREALTALLDYCRDKGIRVISDEIYHGITFGEPAVSAAGLDSGVVVVNSFSKYFSMTGWRLGWLVVPEDMLRAVECLAQNLFISPPTLSQIAAVAAFDCHDELQANLARYGANREFLLAELPKAGFSDLAPSDGAFYLYADVGTRTNDSRDFCARILNETGVAITSGLDFDADRGNRTVRFSFAGSTEEIEAAAEALKNWGG